MITDDGVLPIALGDNWVYAVISEGEAVLVDAGPDFDRAWEALIAQLEAAGLSLGDVRSVFVTHAHIDHCGLAHRWQDQGVPVASWSQEAPQFLHGRNIIGYQTQYVFQALARMGTPQERVTGFIEEREKMRAAFRAGDDTGGGRRRARWPGLIHGTPFEPDLLLEDGDEIAVGRRRLQMIAAPGHTPGNAVVFEEETGALFSGDQVIPGVIPNPGWHYDLSAQPPRRFRSLPAFAASLEKVGRLGVRRLYPGHGEPSDAVDEELERGRRHHAKRQRQLREALEQGPATPYELMRTLFPRLPDRRLWQAMAEVVGQIDALVENGDALELEEDGRLQIRLA